jgi:hypothetical protein
VERTLTIDGRQVRFKSTAGVAFRYQNQFQKDYLVELYKAIPEVTALYNKDTVNLSLEDLSKLNSERLLEIVWSLAKTADPNIPDPLTWLDEFEEFPVIKIFTELLDLMVKTSKSKKK